MVSSAARVGSINVLLSVNSAQGVSGLNAFAGAVDRTGAGVTRSFAGIDRSIGGLNRSLGNINTRGMTSLTLGALRAGTAIDSLRGFALAAGVAVGGLMPAAIAAGMIRTADGAHRLSNQLRTVTTDSKDLKNTQDALFEVAQRTRSSFEATTTIYARTARATEHLGLSQQKLLRITETVQKAFAVGGASAAEAQGAAIQLSQGIASNRFSGEEFRSVAENAPVLLRGMAESLGVNIGKLREMAHAGELTADVVTKAILDASRKIDEDFAKTTSTIEQAWVRVGNAVTKYAMDSEKASAGSRAIVGSLNFLTDNISGAIDIILALGAALTATFAARRMQAVTGLVSGLKAYQGELAKTAAAEKKLATEQALAAATRARELRQGVIATSRGRKDELGEMRAAMLKSNADKAIAAEQQLATAAQKAGDVRAAADLKAAAAKANATQKWSQFMAVARQEKAEAVASARATLVSAEAQKAATQTRLTGARAYYEMSKAAGVSQKTQIKAGKDLQAALQADLKATNAVAAAQTNMQAALDGTAKKSRVYLAAQKAMETAKKQSVAATAAAAAAELKHTEAVAAHAAAQRTAQAAIASGNLTKEQEAALNKRAEALEKRVTAAKAQSAAATLAARDAARAATAATTKLAAATQAATVRAIALTAAGRALSSVYAFIGGPLGAALLGVGAYMYMTSRQAAIAEEQSAKYADAIKKAGDDSDYASGGIRRAAEALAEVSKEGDAARLTTYASALSDIQTNLGQMGSKLLEAQGITNFFSSSYSELTRLYGAFRDGTLSAEEFRAKSDEIARQDPGLAPYIAEMQQFGDQTDAARGYVDGLTTSLEEARKALGALFQGFIDGKKGRLGTGDLTAIYGGDTQDTINLARRMNPDLFKGLGDDKPKKTGGGSRAPRKTADDRFDNSVQSIYDRIEALRLEREMLGATYYEQVKREEILKLEQEALKQAREEARKKNDADWQSAQISEEKKQKIREVAAALAAEADATRRANEAFELTKDVVKGFFGDLVSNIKEGQSLWEALADSALGALDKIGAKLLDLATDQMINWLFKSFMDFGFGLSLPATAPIPTPRPLKDGGPIYAATGGWLRGPGGPRGDKIPVMASDGEFMVNSRSAKKYAPIIEAINDDRLSWLADGGYVGDAVSSLSMTASGIRGDRQPAYNDNRVYKIDARGAQQGVGEEIKRALREYDREVLPARVNQIANDPYARG